MRLCFLVLSAISEQSSFFGKRCFFFSDDPPNSCHPAMLLRLQETRVFMAPEESVVVVCHSQKNLFLLFTHSLRSAAGGPKAEKRL